MEVQHALEIFDQLYAEYTAEMKKKWPMLNYDTRKYDTLTFLEWLNKKGEIDK